MKRITEQKAIEIIKCAIAEVEWNYPLDYAIAFDMAIQALEKQIPKKMKKLDAKHPYNLCYECPNCKALYNGYYQFKPHCLDCGQAIDWSEEE